MTPAGLSSHEVARKVVHIGAGLFALLVPWLTWWQGVLICLAAAFMNWQVLPRITHHFLERPEDRRRGYAAGIIEYPLAVGGLFLLFGSAPHVVAASWAILAFGDGFATVFGRALGGPKLPWNPGKSVSGFLAFSLMGGAGAALLAAHVLRQSAGAGGVAGGPSIGFVAAACFAAALLGALVESLPSGINDNISVPLMTGGFLFGLSFVDPALLSHRQDAVLSSLAIGAAVNLVVSGLAWLARAVKPSGAIVGSVIGMVTWGFGGWQAFAILILFFVVASGATRVGYEEKAARRIAQEEGGRRGARHAVANCGVPAFMAFLAAATPHTDLFMLALVAALATAVFDTVSSEIGQVYGRHPFLITTFRPVPAGTDGAVSVEGTLAGLGAAGLLAAAAGGLGMMGSFGWAGAGLAVVAAFIGTTVESYLGATLEAARAVDNEAMNFTNTLVGASAAMGLALLIQA
ncbi:MAG TPA: DUF92 domain-containing protein [Candidatus Polarisedimenticolia bacterium]|nr:DUF92 domain-containing protein [Candidatus Polarisedimenticolia bacterium]